MWLLAVAVLLVSCSPSARGDSGDVLDVSSPSVPFVGAEPTVPGVAPGAEAVAAMRATGTGGSAAESGEDEARASGDDVLPGPSTAEPADGGAAGDAPASLAGVFTILDYNVHGLPSFITGDDTPGRMRLIGPLLDDFELVGLQEDFDAANHALLTAASTYPYEAYFADPLPNRLYGPGLTALSAYPVVETYHQHYSVCFGELIGPGLTDCVASKGFQVLRMQLSAAPGGELDVYNTHMDAGGGAEDQHAREVQIDELLHAMLGYSAERALVFVADTNASPAQLERLVVGAGLRDACEVVDCPEPGRIERILVRGSRELEVSVTQWRNEPAFVDSAGTPLSDHPAVSAEIAWRIEPR